MENDNDLFKGVNGYNQPINTNNMETINITRNIKNFKDLIVSFRKIKGLSMEDAAKAMGISATYLHYIQTGGRVLSPRSKTLKKIAEVLDIPEPVMNKFAKIQYDNWKTKGDYSDDKRELISRIHRLDERLVLDVIKHLDILEKKVEVVKAALPNDLFSNFEGENNERQ